VLYSTERCCQCKEVIHSVDRLNNARSPCYSISASPHLGSCGTAHGSTSSSLSREVYSTQLTRCDNGVHRLSREVSISGPSPSVRRCRHEHEAVCASDFVLIRKYHCRSFGCGIRCRRHHEKVQIPLTKRYGVQHKTSQQTIFSSGLEKFLNNTRCCSNDYDDGGKTLPGFKMPTGSNTPLSALIVARVAGSWILFMCLFLA
jgi:hypothetical protein